jgi:hypothetical protein
MTNYPLPHFAGPASAVSYQPPTPARYEPLTQTEVWARRSLRASEGWLAGLIRAGSASRRRDRIQSNRPDRGAHQRVNRP